MHRACSTGWVHLVKVRLRLPFCLWLRPFLPIDPVESAQMRRRCIVSVRTPVFVMGTKARSSLIAWNTVAQQLRAHLVLGHDGLSLREPTDGTKGKGSK